MAALPDDLVRRCLLGVPYNSHANLKSVCEGWEAMVSSPRFYADRKISGTSQQLICLIRRNHRVDNNLVFILTLYDPEEGTWETLPSIDEPQCRGIPISCQCVAVNRKLVLISGIHPSETGLTKSVYIYDFESARWIRGADISTPRHNFASSASSSTGLIYVAGGDDEHHRPLASAEAYNVEEDRWEILPPMTQQRGSGCQAVFLEGKFMVVGGHELDRSAEVFDPNAGTWRRWEDMWSFGGHLMDPGGLVATCSGDLYVFVKEEIMKYDVQRNIWTAVASLPPEITFVSSAVQWRDLLFVTGVEFFKNKRHFFLFNPSKLESIEVHCDSDGEIFASQAVEI